MFVLEDGKVLGAGIINRNQVDAYRKLGYKDRGGFTVDVPGLKLDNEVYIFFVAQLLSCSR